MAESFRLIGNMNTDLKSSWKPLVKRPYFIWPGVVALYGLSQEQARTQFNSIFIFIASVK